MCVQKDTVGWWYSFSLMWTLTKKAVLPLKSCGSSEGRCLRTLTICQMTKYFFSILEIGYCSHTMYRAKYMLVSSHLCTLPFSPTFPFPVGNKWPFCNRILLSWVLIICAMLSSSFGVVLLSKLENQSDLGKIITNSY